MPGSIYDKSTKELFKEFIDSFVPPPAKEFSLIKRKPLDEGGYFTRQDILRLLAKGDQCCPVRFLHMSWR